MFVTSVWNVWHYCYLNNVSEKFVSSVWKCYNMQVDRTLIFPPLDRFLLVFPWNLGSSGIAKAWSIGTGITQRLTAAIAVAWLISRLRNNLMPLPLDLHSVCHHALQTCLYTTLLSPSSLSPQLLWSNRLDYCKSLSNPPSIPAPCSFSPWFLKKANILCQSHLNDSPFHLE